VVGVMRRFALPGFIDTHVHASGAVDDELAALTGMVESDSPTEPPGCPAAWSAFRAATPARLSSQACASRWPVPSSPC
jgi:hypothetical protein